MEDIVLRLQYGPYRLCRVGIGADQAVYLPVRKEGPSVIQSHQAGAPVWCDEAFALYVEAYADHVEVRLTVRTPDKQEDSTAAAA